MDSPLIRFLRSMEIDYEKWHDGVGYDLEALNETEGDERKAAEAALLQRDHLDWRDIEALATLDTPRARERLRKASSGSDLETRLALIMHAPSFISEEVKVRTLAEAVRTANLYGGLSQALDLVASFHPPEIVEELLQGIISRSGEVASLFAATLLYIYGKSDDPVDMKNRGFYLRFNTDSSEERRVAFKELCNLIGVESSHYL